MEHLDHQEKNGINWTIVVLFLFLATGLIAIGLIYYPVVLYLAGVLFFIANLFFVVRRRKRARQEREKTWVNSDDLF